MHTIGFQTIEAKSFDYKLDSPRCLCQIVTEPTEARDDYDLYVQELAIDEAQVFLVDKITRAEGLDSIKGSNGEIASELAAFIGKIKTCL